AGGRVFAADQAELPAGNGALIVAAAIAAVAGGRSEAAVAVESAAAGIDGHDRTLRRAAVMDHLEAAGAERRIDAAVGVDVEGIERVAVDAGPEVGDVGAARAGRPV